MSPRTKRLRSVVAAAKRRTKGSIGRQWREACRRKPIVPNKVLFEVYGGNGLSGAPEAVFRELAQNHRGEGFTFVWVVSDERLYAREIAHLRSFAPFEITRRGSRSYHRHLYSSQYLVNNMSFPADFVKREGQTYLNTWHGIPLKKMGYDVVGRVQDARNIVRNFLACDYLLSNSGAMTQRMYLGAFRLTNLFRGTILEEGSPAEDFTLNPRARDELADLYPDMGLHRDHRKIVLYAPTWRGGDYAQADSAIEVIWDAVSTLQDSLDPTRYRVLVKAHQAVQAALSGEPRLAGMLVPAGVNPNSLLGITDILVTDYSSIFYDFLITGRPVIHFIPDQSAYAQYRDVYEDPGTWPGDVAWDTDQLRHLVGDATAADWQPTDTYRRAAETWVPHEDGAVTPRVVSTVFTGARSDRSLTAPTDDRETIVMYVGPLNRNGITSSVRNLLQNIDHSRYDVTALVPYNSTDLERLELANDFDPRVRVMFRFGDFTGSATSNWIRDMRFRLPGMRFGKPLVSQVQLWKQEWKRIFGAAQFDHLIDYTGYSPFWGALFISADGGNRLIWQHNDLQADANRTVDGQRHLYNGLNKVFALYPYFDWIVSVSEELRDINRKSLATSVTWDRFEWVPNTLDVERLAATEAEPKGSSASDVFTFVNVGRLSPEKNQMRLLGAFQEVAAHEPRARLELVGDGPQRQQLEARAIELKIEDRVEFTGMLSNPYPRMKSADCLVVSSDYEGQPMVILEAKSLGLPVVSTAFGSVNGALQEGEGLIVEPRMDRLAEAMLKAAQTYIPFINFDPCTYNRTTLGQLEKLLTISPEPPHRIV